jgi:hypothetical protein
VVAALPHVRDKVSDCYMLAHTNEQRPRAHPEVDGDGVEYGNGNRGDEEIEELVSMVG